MLSKWFHPTDPQIIEKKKKKNTLWRVDDDGVGHDACEH